MSSDIVQEKLGKGINFERIRRITGYLVGTMDKWNSAKRAEEHDRVIHSLRFSHLSQEKGSHLTEK